MLVAYAIQGWRDTWIRRRFPPILSFFLTVTLDPSSTTRPLSSLLKVLLKARRVCQTEEEKLWEALKQKQMFRIKPMKYR